MPIAQEMKSLTDKIVGDYETRVSVLGNLISDTHDTLKGFNRDRMKMGAQQSKDLSSFVGDLASSTHGLLKGFSRNHKEMANDQAESLEKFNADLGRNVKKMLKEFESSHAEMSEEMKKDLGSFVKGITGETKRILSSAQKMVAEYRNDISGAADAWQKMAGQLARARHGVAVRIEKGKPIGAGIQVSAAEKSAKPKGKRGRRKKR